MLGLGLSLTTGGVATPAYVVLAKAFVSRVEADGGTVDSFACLKTDMAYLTSNPGAPAGYTAEWSGATVGSSAEFRINLVGGAGYTYTYAVTDTQATEVTGTGVMGGDIQAVTADLSTLVDGTVTLAVYLTGAGGDGNVVTDTANLVGYTGLLDTYSGAAAAYSLRLLDTSYTGDAIVVRRASDNTTQAIGFVNNELDTASLESFCSGTDGFVTTWYDQSGNANNTTQTTAGDQPKIVSSGSTILENGKATLSLDHTALQKLTGATGYDISTFTQFSVAKQLGDSFLFSIQTSNSAGIRQQVNGSTFTSRITTSNISVTSSPTANNQFLLTSLYDGTNGYTYLNNTQSASATLSVSDVLSANMEIGSASAVNASTFGGTIQEMIFYESDESTNRTGIETNINDFYSIY